MAAGGVGYGVQIVQVTDSHRFVLDEEALAGVLLREDVQQLPVVLVSVAGAYRGGKSFLLNFFLRYLTAPQSARDDGSWLFNGENLEGFSWRSGTKRNTTGIQIWSQPFICNITPEKKVAVLLMDTQGTFDSSSTMADCTNIFALSTLLCSVQIYNLSKTIQEDHLQHLQLFCEYGRVIHDEGHGKAFQTLMFLLRDWQNAEEYDYGSVGGEEFLKSKLKIHDNMPEELQAVRLHIASFFEKISCFLMPLPGNRLFKPGFRGQLHEIDDEFKQHVKDLVESILKPMNLVPKEISRKEINAKELFSLFKSYMTIFKSGKMPPTSSIMQELSLSTPAPAVRQGQLAAAQAGIQIRQNTSRNAVNVLNIFAEVTTEANLHAAIREMAAQYEHNMERECGENVPSLSADDVKELHERYKQSALTNYSAKKLMGSKKIIESYQKKLSKDIDNLAEIFAAMNSKKRQAVIEASEKAYKDKINEYKDDDLICVHPDDLVRIHRSALTIALNTFDSLVRRISMKKDGDRENFETRMANEYNLLKVQNERSNKRLVDDLRLMYWEHMQPSVLADPPPFPAQLKRAHDEGLERVMEIFNQKRKCLASSYARDHYKDMILQEVNAHYNDIKAMNVSVNGKAINAAVAEYSAHVNKNWNQRNEHLHPDEFEQLHDEAQGAALATLLGNRRQQDMSQTDRDTLQRMITKRYTAFKETNIAANNEAVQTAYNVFVSTLEEQRRAKWYWIFIVPLVATALADLLGELFNNSKREAIKEFYKNRKNEGKRSADEFYQELLKKINKHDPWAMLRAGYEYLKNYIKNHFQID